LLQGGASLQFAMVPLNLLGSGRTADYIVTGAWSKKAVKEAKSVGGVRIAASTEQDGKFRRIPKQNELDLDKDSAYVHITSNNTIAGTQWHDFPEVGAVPLVADMSSDIMWRPIEVSKFGLIYAGAQKNLGPSGLTLVVLKKALLQAGRQDIPAILQYRIHAQEKSLYNTPPTFSVYLYRNVLEELKNSGGLPEAERRNRQKGDTLYAAIDARKDFYVCPIERESRSYMNVVFNLPTPELEAEFIAEAQKRNMFGLKGHRSVGGIRVSTYNAVSLEWVQTLVEFMDGFRRGA
jgi:phosphoserine aminotransferase